MADEKNCRRVDVVAKYDLCGPKLSQDQIDDLVARLKKERELEQKLQGSEKS